MRALHLEIHNITYGTYYTKHIRKMYKWMKKRSEIKWSEVARKAIAEYLNGLKGKSTIEEIRGGCYPPETLRTLKAISKEKAIEMHKELWVRNWQCGEVFETNLLMERLKSLLRLLCFRPKSCIL